MAADLLTRIRAEIDARLRELQPLLAEYERLLSAADALAEEARAVPAPAPRPRPRLVRHRGRPRWIPAADTPAEPTAPAADLGGEVGTKPARPASPTYEPPERVKVGRRATGQAILAALEHGSHTVAELVMVTAIAAPDIRDGLRRLRRQKAIVKTEREGKTAYALPA
jgi:hypothetical protein